MTKFFPFTMLVLITGFIFMTNSALADTCYPMVQDVSIEESQQILHKDTSCRPMAVSSFVSPKEIAIEQSYKLLKTPQKEAGINKPITDIAIENSQKVITDVLYCPIVN